MVHPLGKTVWRFLKILKIATTILSSNPTSGYISKRTEIRISKRYLHSYIHCCIIHNTEDMETTQTLMTDEWIKRMWYMHIVEYYSALKKKEILPFARTWMNLEEFMLSEISQLQKYKHGMAPLI